MGDGVSFVINNVVMFIFGKEGFGNLYFIIFICLLVGEGYYYSLND